MKNYAAESTGKAFQFISILTTDTLLKAGILRTEPFCLCRHADRSERGQWAGALVATTQFTPSVFIHTARGRSRVLIAEPAKTVILFIGGAMGPSTETAAPILGGPLRCNCKSSIDHHVPLAMCGKDDFRPAEYR